MSPNIRACNNHSFSGYYSHSKTTRNYTLSPPPYSYCPVGHFACVFSPSTTVTLVTSLNQTTTTKSTSLTPPLNIRSKTHTHSYEGISVSQGYGQYLGDTLTCDRGHSGCLYFIFRRTYTDFTVSTTNITRSLTPQTPVNVKQKVHQHILPDTVLSWSSETYNYATSIGNCSYGHTNCVTSLTSITWIRVGTASSTTSLN
jgi:hypothetical protein